MVKQKQKNRYKPYTNIALVLIILTAIPIAALLKNSLDVIWYWVIIVVYFILVSAFVRYRLPKNYLSNDFRKEIIDLTTVSFIALAFFGFATTAGEGSDKISLNLPFDNYEFTLHFRPTNNIILNNFQVYYDFRNNNGNITFTIKEINNTIGTEGFFIYLPKNLEPTGYIFQKDNKILLQKRDYNVYNRTNNDGSKIIGFEEFKKSLESTDFSLQFKGNLIPNGLYRFYVHNKFTWAQRGETIIFDLGDYECKSSCFENLYNAERQTNGNIFRIKYLKDFYGKNQDESKMLQQFFILNTYSLPSLNIKGDLKNLQIGLLISGFVLIGEAVKYLIGLFRYH